VANVDVRTSNAHSGGSRDSPVSAENANKSFKLCVAICKRLGRRSTKPDREIWDHQADANAFHSLSTSHYKTLIMSFESVAKAVELKRLIENGP